MQEETRLKFNELTKAMANTYGVNSVASTFAASPAVEQKLVDAVKAKSKLMQLINVVPVRDMTGEKVLGSASGVIGKRTNTNTGERSTSSALNLDDAPYVLKKTEYDIHTKYDTIDMWSRFPDLQKRFLGWSKESIAEARESIAWYGESAEDETDPDLNPLGQDVNKGWFQVLREYEGGQQMLSEGNTAGQIRVGSGGDFINLDSLVFDVKQSIDEKYRDKPGLVVIIGSDLMAVDKAQLYVAQGDTPSEKERIENSAVIRTYGGLPAHTIPGFPARGLLITTFKNLSYYYQAGAVRQHIIDNPKKEQVEHYNSLNEGFVFEDAENAAAIEFKNVRLHDGVGWV